MSKPFRNAYDTTNLRRDAARAMLLASGWKKNKLNTRWHKKPNNPEVETRFYTLREALELHHQSTEAR